jgi:hypothetical protein
VSTSGLKHVCEAYGCLEVIPVGLLMCPTHWAQVPQDLQRKVYKLWHQLRRGRGHVTEEYRAAVEQAREHVGGGRPRRSLRLTESEVDHDN